MLADLQNIISDKQSIAAGASTLIGTNIIDLGVVGTIPQGGSPIADFGRGHRRPPLHIQITTTVTSGGAATVDFQICGSANSDLSSPTVLEDSGVIGKATLVQGYIVPIGFAMPFIAQRYLGMQYVIGTATTTAGNVVAELGSTRQTTPYVTQ